jgi:hypothetical protein
MARLTDFHRQQVATVDWNPVERGGGASPCVTVGARWSPREAVGGVGRRREWAEGQARGDDGNGSTVEELSRVRGTRRAFYCQGMGERGCLASAWRPGHAEGGMAVTADACGWSAGWRDVLPGRASTQAPRGTREIPGSICLGGGVRDHLVPALAVLEVRGANPDDGMSAATWQCYVTLPTRHALWRRGCPFPFEAGNLIKLWFKNFELSEPTFEFAKL